LGNHISNRLGGANRSTRIIILGIPEGIEAKAELVEIHG
jgi:hypothetical protein